MSKKILILLFFFATLTGIILYDPDSTYAPSLPETFSDSPTLSIHDKVIKIDIADTLSETQRGLSGRKGLGTENGMLFILSEEQIPSFWMKDMNFAIDIIWINKDWKIVDIIHNLAPETYPNTFSPKQPVKYVLEVNAGWSKKYNIAVGDPVVFNR